MKQVKFFLLGIVIVGMLPSGVAASSLSVTSRITSSVQRPALVDKPSPRTISHDGRFSVFASGASDLVPGDTNNASDIFLYDRQTRRLELITRTPSGQPATGASATPSISATGRNIVFASYAKNLLTNPQEVFCGGTACRNIFAYDRQTKLFTLVNRSSVGLRMGADEWQPHLYAPTISADGRLVAFRTTHPIGPTDTNNDNDIALRDLNANLTRLGSVDVNGNPPASGASEATLSRDGRYLVFTTFSPLIPEDTNETYDIYRRDLQTGEIRLVSRNKQGGPTDRASYQAVISGDGRFVSYLSRATNIIDGDTNEANDIYLYDSQTSTTRRITVSSRGKQSDFETYQHDISHDGRFMVYMSGARNLVPNDTNDAYDIFLFDSQAHLTRRINRASADGAPAAYGPSSSWPSISGDGRVVQFVSDAHNLVPSPQVIPAGQLYEVFNPVVTIPFYDHYSIIDLYH